MTIQFYHKKCKSIITLDCSGLFKIVCVACGTTRTQLRPSSIDILQNEEAFTPKYICDHCGVVKDLNDIVSVCNKCGEIKPVSNLERVFKNGEIVCSECKEKNYKEEQTRTLSKIMIAMSLG
jgi:hypothetical protein